MAYKQKHQYGFRDSLEKGDPEKVIYGQYFDDEFKSIEEALEAIDPDSDGKVEINEIDGLQDALDNKADKDHTHEEYLTDAPDDGAQYVRESGAWAEVTIPEAGISEPTSDGKPYSRQVEGGQVVGAWVEAPTTDDIEYLDGRIDAIEGSISGGGGFVEAPDDGDDYARNGKSPAWVKTYNADYIDALEADYKNADAGKADKDHNHDSDYAPIDHTHTTDEITGLDDKIAEIEGDITDLEGAVGELTGQLALGGSYNASTGLVVTANLSSFTAGQPLPDYSTVPNTFVIVVEAGNNPEELGEGDWLVAGQSGWVAIKYGTAGSVDWDNISNVPDFDLAYAPIDHTHEIADVDGLQDALDAAGESLWTQNGDNIYYSDGNVGIGIDNPDVFNRYNTRTLGIEGSGNTSVAINSVSNTGTAQLDFGVSNARTGGITSNTNETNISTLGATPLNFATDTSIRMTLDASGNVGIGTASPASFGVLTAAGANPQIVMEDTAAGTNGKYTAIGTSNGAMTFNRYLDNGTLVAQYMTLDASGRVGIGGQPSRSTKEVEEEAEATLRNWESKDKKPTKAELIKKLAERDIGGGTAKLQVAGDGYFSGYVSAAEGYFRPNGTGSAGVQLVGQGAEYAEIQTFENKVGYTNKPLVINRQGGNVGIGGTPGGTISGGNARLQVSGDGYFSGEVKIGTGDIFSSGNTITLSHAAADGMLHLRVNAQNRLTIDADGRVGIGGEPSRSTKEIEEEAEATLRNWDSKDKKPTKAELVKRLTERNIGGGTAKLQVAGDGYFSGNVYAGGLATDNHVLKDAHSGLTFQTNAIIGLNSNNSNAFGQVDFGSTAVPFKDAHFSGTIYGKVDDVPDHVKSITPTQIANWDAGTGGGGGATTDGRISDTQITNWDTAYGWGNHASAGYAKGSFVPTSGNSTISGTLTATDFVATSDERLKDNISPMPVGLIDDIKPVQWTWKDSGKKSAGVIAQQLQEIGLDDFVTEGEDGMLGVNYNALVSVLLAEVISLKKELAR